MLPLRVHSGIAFVGKCRQSVSFNGLGQLPRRRECQVGAVFSSLAPLEFRLQTSCRNLLSRTLVENSCRRKLVDESLRQKVVTKARGQGACFRTTLRGSLSGIENPATAGSPHPPLRHHLVEHGQDPAEQLVAWLHLDGRHGADRTVPPQVQVSGGFDRGGSC